MSFLEVCHWNLRQFYRLLGRSAEGLVVNPAVEGRLGSVSLDDLLEVLQSLTKVLLVLVQLLEDLVGVGHL